MSTALLIAEYGQSLSRLPQRSTALDGLPGRLNIVPSYYNSLSEPFRQSGLRKPGPISSNQVLAQQDGLAERWRDRDRAGSFALTEGWQDRLRDRNAGERTSVDRFVEFHVFYSHGWQCDRHRLREGQNYEPALVVGVMTRSDYSSATTSAPNPSPEHPHSAVTATAYSAAGLLSVLSPGSLRSDSSGRGGNGTPDVGASVDNQSVLSSAAVATEFNEGALPCFRRRDSIEFVRRTCTALVDLYRQRGALRNKRGDAP